MEIVRKIAIAVAREPIILGETRADPCDRVAHRFLLDLKSIRITPRTCVGRGKVASASVTLRPNGSRDGRRHRTSIPQSLDPAPIGSIARGRAPLSAYSRNRPPSPR